MNTMRLVSHSAGMMRRHKVRTGFMMVGSFIGVATLTLVVSVGQAVKQKMVAMARQVFGEDSIMVMDGGGHMLGAPRNPGTRLKLDDAQAIAERAVKKLSQQLWGLAERQKQANKEEQP